MENINNMIDPFDMPEDLPDVRDTLPNTLLDEYAYQLEEMISKIECDAHALNIKLTLAQESLDGIVSSTSALIKMIKKENNTI